MVTGLAPSMAKLIASLLAALAILGGVHQIRIGAVADEEQVFAHVNATSSIVDEVIVITQTTLDQNGGWYVGTEFKPKSEWVQTSTKGTVKKNYGGKGMYYDKTRDAFYKPKSNKNMLFNETKARWELPNQFRDPV